jgi:hypothetical protein
MTREGGGQNAARAEAEVQNRVDRRRSLEEIEINTTTTTTIFDFCSSPSVTARNAISGSRAFIPSSKLIERAAGRVKQQQHGHNDAAAILGLPSS